MTTITELSSTLQALLTSKANELARTTGFIQRQRQITGAGFAQTLVLGGLAQPNATRREQQQTAAQVGMKITSQGLEQRFTPSATAFMKALLKEGLTQLVSSEQSRPLLPQFNGVYVTDCTRLDWREAGVKLGVRWELQQGQLQASLSDLSQHDQKTAVIDQPLPTGALHLADLGFFKLSRFQTWSDQGVYWLTRFKVGTCLYQPDGTSLDLLAWLTPLQQPQTLLVQVGSKERLSAYLVAAPTPDDAYAKRLARLQEQARLDQRPLSAQQAAYAHWTLYLTNLPEVTFAQAHLLARIRWQIELLFKLWKSHGKVLVARTADPIRRQCEGYAKLLGVLVAHWCLLVTGWQHDRLNGLDALRLVRRHAALLTQAVLQPSLWADFFIGLRQALDRCSPRSKRGKNPLLFQLCQTFDLVLP